MEAGHQTLSREGLISTLRYITAAVQVMPFIYSVLYILSLAIGLFASDDVVKTFDMLFYASPVTVVSFLIFSRLLKMCRWHRTACLVPIFPQIISFIDYYVVQFPLSVLAITIVTLIAMTVLLLAAAYKTFIQ